MAVIDELVALLGFKLSGEGNLKKFNSGVDAADKKLIKLERAAARGQRGIDNMVSGIKSGGPALGKFTKNLSKAATAVTAVGVAAGAFIAKGVISTGAQFEKLSTTLETIEGSSEAAEASLAWVQKFTTKTPYELTQVSDAFVKMRAYGLNPTNGSLETLGDTASAMGKDLLQAVEAYADALTGENERLKEFGVKAKVEGDKVTYAWTQNGKQLKKTVSNDSESIQAALLEIFGDKFSGAMKKQSGTLIGIWSNIKDVFTNIQKAIGDAGFFENFKAGLKGVLDRLNDLQGSEKGRLAIQKISDALYGMSKAVFDFIENITVDDILNTINAITTVVGGTVKALSLFVKGVLWLKSALQSTFGEGTGGAIFVGVLVTLFGIVSGIIPVLLTLGKVAYGAAQFLSGFGSTAVTAFGGFSKVVPILALIVGAIGAMSNVLKDFANGDINNIGDLFMSIWEGIYDSLFGSLIKMNAAVAEWFYGLLGIDVSPFTDIMRRMASWEGLVDVFMQLRDAIIQWAIDTGKAIGEAIVNAIKAALGLVADLAKAAVDVVINPVKGKLNDAGDAVKSGARNAAGAIDNGIDSVGNFFGGLLGKKDSKPEQTQGSYPSPLATPANDAGPRPTIAQAAQPLAQAANAAEMIQTAAPQQLEQTLTTNNETVSNDNSTTSITINQTVNGETAPDAAGRAVSSAVDRGKYRNQAVTSAGGSAP